MLKNLKSSKASTSKRKEEMAIQFGGETNEFIEGESKTRTIWKTIGINRITISYMHQ